MGVLTKIRQMPDNQKKIFSFATAAVLTLIIVVIWFSSSEKDSLSQTATVSETKLSSFSPLQIIREEFSKAFSRLNNSVIGSGGGFVSTSSIPVEILESASSSEKIN